MNSEPMLFKRPRDGVIKVRPSVQQVLQGYVQRTPRMPEAGGVLMGSRLLEGGDVVISAVSVPMPGDHQSRFRFIRQQEHHQRCVERAWKNSGGIINYLGEWHTHPENDPNPSALDKGEWRRLVKECHYDGEELFFLIVGIESWGLWEVASTGGAVRKLLGS